MPTIVRSGGGGVDVSEATAVVSEVLSGSTFYAGEDSEIKTGTMVNHGAKTINVDEIGSTGYYSSISVNPDSLGTATENDVLSTVTFTNNSKVTKQGKIAVKGAATINVGETGGAGYYSSVAINKSSLGNAKEEDVLSTVTFTNNSGITKNGTMINHGSFTCALEYGENTTASGAGYYSSISVSAPTLTGKATAEYVYKDKTFMNESGEQVGQLQLNGNATKAQVLQGQTFHAGDSIRIQCGTMINRGQVSESINPGDSWYGGEGYYSSISIQANQDPTRIFVLNDITASSTWSNTDTGFSDWSYVTVGYATSRTAGYWDSDSHPKEKNKPGVKYYLSGTRIHYCTNGSSNITGMKLRALAWYAED